MEKTVGADQPPDSKSSLQWARRKETSGTVRRRMIFMEGEFSVCRDPRA